MNSIESNKLMATFLGWQYTEETETQFALFHVGENTYTIGTLKFNSDWNWLIEVVKKITDMGIFVKYDNSKFYKCISKFEIKTTYNACIEFIKWYNQQSK